MPERKSIECDDFRDDHIYVDLGLAPMMGTLITEYPYAKWVHLIRNRDDCVRSLLCHRATKRDLEKLSKILYWPMSVEQTAEAYWLHTNNMIRRMLPEQQFTMRMEEAREYWSSFWNWIGAEGDFEKSRDTWLEKFNSSGYPGRNSSVPVEC